MRSIITRVQIMSKRPADSSPGGPKESGDPAPKRAKVEEARTEQQDGDSGGQDNTEVLQQEGGPSSGGNPYAEVAAVDSLHAEVAGGNPYAAVDSLQNPDAEVALATAAGEKKADARSFFCGFWRLVGEFLGSRDLEALGWTCRDARLDVEPLRAKGLAEALARFQDSTLDKEARENAGKEFYNFGIFGGMCVRERERSFAELQLVRYRDSRAIFQAMMVVLEQTPRPALEILQFAANMIFAEGHATQVPFWLLPHEFETDTADVSVARELWLTPADVERMRLRIMDRGEHWTDEGIRAGFVECLGDLAAVFESGTVHRLQHRRGQPLRRLRKKILPPEASQRLSSSVLQAAHADIVKAAAAVLMSAAERPLAVRHMNALAEVNDRYAYGYIAKHDFNIRTAAVAALGELVQKDLWRATEVSRRSPGSMSPLLGEPLQKLLQLASPSGWASSPPVLQAIQSIGKVCWGASVANGGFCGVSDLCAGFLLDVALDTFGSGAEAWTSLPSEPRQLALLADDEGEHVERRNIWRTWFNDKKMVLESDRIRRVEALRALIDVNSQRPDHDVPAAVVSAVDEGKSAGQSQPDLDFVQKRILAPLIAAIRNWTTAAGAEVLWKPHEDLVAGAIEHDIFTGTTAIGDEYEKEFAKTSRKSPLKLLSSALQLLFICEDKSAGPCLTDAAGNASGASSTPVAHTHPQATSVLGGSSFSSGALSHRGASLLFDLLSSDVVHLKNPRARKAFLRTWAHYAPCASVESGLFEAWLAAVRGEEPSTRSPSVVDLAVKAGPIGGPSEEPKNDDGPATSAVAETSGKKTAEVEAGVVSAPTAPPPPPKSIASPSPPIFPAVNLPSDFPALPSLSRLERATLLKAVGKSIAARDWPDGRYERACSAMFFFSAQGLKEKRGWKQTFGKFVAAATVGFKAVSAREKRAVKAAARKRAKRDLDKNCVGEDGNANAGAVASSSAVGASGAVAGVPAEGVLGGSQNVGGSGKKEATQMILEDDSDEWDSSDYEMEDWEVEEEGKDSSDSEE